MKMQYGKEEAIAPVVATLLMIAIAPAMSVGVFIWSHGFPTQRAQVHAAQSGISIELARFVQGTSVTGGTTCAGAATDGEPSITIVTRNVSDVPLTLESLTISGTSNNTGFKGSIEIPVVGAAAAASSEQPAASDPPTGTIPTTTEGASGSLWKWSTTGTVLSKGASATIVVCNVGSTTTALADTGIASGDVISVKLTTYEGTLASEQFTVQS